MRWQTGVPRRPRPARGGGSARLRPGLTKAGARSARKAPRCPPGAPGRGYCPGADPAFAPPKSLSARAPAPWAPLPGFAPAPPCSGGENHQSPPDRGWRQGASPKRPEVPQGKPLPQSAHRRRGKAPQWASPENSGLPPPGSDIWPAGTDRDGTCPCPSRPEDKGPRHGVPCPASPPGCPRHPRAGFSRLARRIQPGTTGRDRPGTATQERAMPCQDQTNAEPPTRQLQDQDNPSRSRARGRG